MLALFALAIIGCGGESATSPTPDGGQIDDLLTPARDGAVEGRLIDGPMVDQRSLGDGALRDPDGAVDDIPRPSLGRGLRWVRSNPMFLSGIVISMGAPPSSWVNTYFDDFNANAVHLWASGLPASMNGWRAARPGARWVSWVNRHGTSADNGQVIGGYAADTPGRIGYQVGDEPWDMATVKIMEAGVNKVRRASEAHPLDAVCVEGSPGTGT